jgi:hypothetical protein
MKHLIAWLKGLFIGHTLVSMPSKDNPTVPYKCSCGLEFLDPVDIFKHID